MNSGDKFGTTGKDADMYNTSKGLLFGHELY